MSADKFVIPEFKTFTAPNIRRRPMSLVDTITQKTRYEIMSQEDESIFAAIDALGKRKYNICG